MAPMVVYRVIQHEYALEMDVADMRLPQSPTLLRHA